LAGLFCNCRIDERTLLLKSSLLVTVMRPTVSAFRCFHTSSSGLRSASKAANKTAVAHHSNCRQRLGFLGDMSWSAIDDEKDGALCAGRQSFQKLNEHIGVDAALLDKHEPHVAARSDRDIKLIP